MKKKILYILLFSSISSFSFAHFDTLHSKQIEFIENKGQWDHQVYFKAEIDGGAIFLEKDLLTFTFLDMGAIEELLHFKHKSNSERDILPQPNNIIDCHAYKVRFLNANPKVGIKGEQIHSDYNNYFIGKDPSKWASEVRKFQTITYYEIWKNIDLKFYEEGNLLKYDVIIHPGGKSGDVAFEYEGIERLSLRNGNLIIKTSVNKITELIPDAYQMDGQNKVKVRCTFKVKGNSVYFEFPDGYNPQKELIVDPLIFSTYSGSTIDNWGYTATYDNLGFLYAGGIAFGTGYPVKTGSYQIIFGGGNCDIAVSKYDTTGSFMVYSSYLGGSGSEVPNSLIVNDIGELFVLATTGSSDYPVTPTAYDTSFNGGATYTLTVVVNFPNGSDIAVSRFSSNGSALLSSTYFGGIGNDGLNTVAPLRHNYADEARGEIIIDHNSNCYVVSTTQSNNFPVSAGTFQPFFGGGSQDGCIIKLDQNLSTLIWSSYLGGSEKDAVYSVVLDDNDNVYVCGGTNSTNFPITSYAIFPSYIGGKTDGFITKIDKNGQIILYSTYFGHTHYDQVYFVERDKSGYLYVLGQIDTAGTALIHNALWSTPNGGLFISKLTPKLDSIKWSTTFGSGNGLPNLSPTAFMVDYCDNIYLSGWGGPSLNGFGGTSGLPVTSNAFQTTTDNNDYYFMVLNSTASNLIYASYFGGSSSEHVDGGTSRFDRKGVIYQGVCAGCGGSSNFPTTSGAWSQTNGSTNCNMGAVKYDFNLPVVLADFIVPYVGCAPVSIPFQNNSVSTGGPGYNCFWDFGDNTSSTVCNPTHTYTQSGVYDVTLIITDSGSCNYSDTVVKQVVVLSNSSSNLPDIDICLGETTQIGILPLPDPNITYSWSPATGLNITSISNPFASPFVTTNYHILVSNGSCTDTIYQTVNVYDLSLDPGPDTLVCINPIKLTASTNEDGALYIWSSNSGFTDTLNASLTDSTVLITLNNPMYYYIRANKAHCVAIDSVFVDFVVITNPSLVKPPTCYGDCDGIATLNIISGTPPYTYSWSTGSTNDTIYNLCGGTYTCTVTDAMACISIETIVVPEPPPFFSNPLSGNIPCVEVCMGTADANVSGSIPPYNYFWNTGQTVNPLTNLCAGTYYFTVSDFNSCQISDSVIVEIIPTFINADAWVDDDTIYSGQTTQIHATNFINCMYSWIPVTGLDDPNSSDPNASPTVTTVYYIVITDQYGCTFIDSVKITVLDVFCDEPYIYVPNAFTPNNDNKNDILYVRSNFIEDVYIAIYDRWGEKVFETDDIRIGWDGTYKGKPCDPGVFVYYLDVTCYNKQIFQKKGNITLIK
ncbi:gliding motility-associated C-terminal domain-containing protein [candidate division KSB1 bacterium]